MMALLSFVTYGNGCQGQILVRSLSHGSIWSKNQTFVHFIRPLFGVWRESPGRYDSSLTPIFPYFPSQWMIMDYTLEHIRLQTP
ncbi:hypothetical protein BS47DRAFT_522613 [Hydnum rufescens UP504]|uniref:Uncharacterized protein n=1 Tax=Hydnum rufescens UP504 TaxID=1448309 RepID=A0A9P6B417_9AGAM|nr:hypothetical protein BS47DRAFT_522613 [Hydnum rufescens UP504]